MLVLGFYLINYAQPHLHIQRNLEAARIDGNQSWLSFWDGPAYKGFLWNNQGTMTLGTSDQNITGQLKFVTNNAERMTINSLGQIGVNTSNPLSLMHIHGDNEILRLSGAQPYLSYYNGLGGYIGYLWNKNLFDFELGTASNNSTGNLFLRTRGNLGIWIDPDGDVGIGAAPAGPKLDVNGEIEANIGITINGEASWRWFESPGYTVSPCEGKKALILNYNGSTIASINGCDGSYSALSDRRFKTDIESWRPEGILSKVKLLKPVKYVMIHSGSESFGFIAQDVQQHFPEIVSMNKDELGNESYGITYGKIGVVAIKAIQEQQEIIESQQTEINILRKRLDAMEEAIAKINSAPLTSPQRK